MPQPFVGRAGIAGGRRLELVVEAPGRGRIADRQDADGARLRRNGEVAEEAARQLTERRVALADRLLSPPGHAAATPAESKRLVDGMAAMGQKISQGLAEPGHLLAAQLLARQAAAGDVVERLDRHQHLPDLPCEPLARKIRAAAATGNVGLDRSTPARGTP